MFPQLHMLRYGVIGSVILVYLCILGVCVLHAGDTFKVAQELGLTNKDGPSLSLTEAGKLYGELLCLALVGYLVSMFAVIMMLRHGQNQDSQPTNKTNK